MYVRCDWVGLSGIGRLVGGPSLVKHAADTFDANPSLLLSLDTLPRPQLQEETELLNSEERPQELEEVSEKIHKRFHIKETPGSSVVKMHTKHDLEKVLVQFDVQDTTEDELNPEELE